MEKLLLFSVLLIINSTIYAQKISPQTLGFEAYKLQLEEIGEVNYYLSLDSNNTKKPLLVYLDGSGAYPLFQQMENGIGSTVVIDFQNLKKDYQILLISKPGVPFIDQVKIDENGIPIYNEPKEYNEKLSQQWRVETANAIINHIIKNKAIDESKVIVLGFSEGAQVAPELAYKNKKITHLLLFGGNGLNQLFDPITTLRMKAYSNQITQEQAQDEIDSLFNEYEKIYKDPTAINKYWWGHTYKRWASFTQKDPYKYLLEIDIPIYIANGSLDENSVLSADYIKLEFIKNNKSNLTYKTYPNYDHQFNELITKNGKVIKATPKLNEVMSSAFLWLKKH